MTMVCCMCGQQPLMTAEHILALAMGTLCGNSFWLGVMQSGGASVAFFCLLVTSQCAIPCCAVALGIEPGLVGPDLIGCCHLTFRVLFTAPVLASLTMSSSTILRGCNAQP
jgi:hypothetical protein